MRDDVVCMMRIRNEERWIARSLERTFQVAKTVVIFDDGSTDNTFGQALHASFPVFGTGVDELPLGTVEVHSSSSRELHYMRSPFRPAVNELEAVSEIRDKNVLWSYIKAQIKFKHVLCLDGDEMLSRDAVRHFDEAITLLEEGSDITPIPFVYLWNDEQHRRVDGIYGNLKDGFPKLRFPRLFTIMRVEPYDLYAMRFEWNLGHRQGRKILGGFHCGSVPQESFIPKNQGVVYPYPIIHFGYLEQTDRQRKFEWYNQIDPGNQWEGEYKHMIEVPNIHAPGPTILEPFEDK